MAGLVRNPYPLQQGLRQFHGLPEKSQQVVRNPYPLQQGLRLFLVHLYSFVNNQVRNPYPLQQGLRLVTTLVSGFSARRQKPISITTRIKTCEHVSFVGIPLVRNPYPLQQGLRQDHFDP